MRNYPEKQHPKGLLFLLLLALIFFFPSSAYTEESALFTSVAPDTLMILDLSGSMYWAPAGEYMYYEWDDDEDVWSFYASPGGPDHYIDHEYYINPYGTVPKWSNETCTGPFYWDYPISGFTTNCSRLAIAKRAIFDILDDTNDNSVDGDDEENLNIRIGYMRFRDGNDTGEDYTKGNIDLIEPIGTRYSDIWGTVSAETANSGTPLASSLHEAKLYLDYHKSKDAAGACRQKFVILITDGADTYACGGDGTTSTYLQRREVVDRAKALADEGYRVFVIGFGADMPDELRYTLNWAAYFGNTDNPLEDNVGDASAYDASLYNNCNANNSTDDPGLLSLTGYAFLASSASDLIEALKQAISIIRESTYSFTMASIQTSRTTDENNLYEASFEPINNDPFWLGHLKKYAINTDGTVGSVVWDAGTVLQATSAASRSIYTYTSGALTAFTTANLAKEYFEVNTDAERDAIVGYIRGDAAYNPDNWKLGDIFRSPPVTIGTPSVFFYDTRDANDAFPTFRENHIRTSVNGQRMIVVGANDGQLHAFSTQAGSETWSFIPPNLLSKLKNLAHTTHPTGLIHQYFVDGPTTVVDVWLGTGDGTSKSSSDWRTLLMFGEGRGGTGRLWSSSSSCDQGFNETYDTSHPYYGGYYCLDVTSSTSPAFKWHLNPSAALAPYLGEPWCKIMPGRVKISGNEKWVGFLGAGYNASDCNNMNKCDERGKGFMIVDLGTGDILWSCTLDDDSTMIYSLPGTGAIVDTDNDGFIDTVYMGDLGGNMWRFKLCRSSDGDTCGTANWSASLLFASSTGVIRPIYTSPAVSRDTDGNLWVYWGTGDKEDPTAANAQEKLYAVKDNDLTTTWSINNLENITSGVYSNSSSNPGWYINFAGQGEKVLAEPTVFGGVVYLTTFTPDQSGDPCSYGGDANLYGIEYTTGAGVLTPEGDRSLKVGTGIPTAPVISLKPGANLSPDLYVTVSSSGTEGGSNTLRVNFDPPTLANRTNMLYWKDNRLD